MLVFERCFWDRSQDLFGHISHHAESRGELFLFWSTSDQPILTGLVAGRAAAELESEKRQRLSPGSRLSSSSTATGAGGGPSNSTKGGSHTLASSSAASHSITNGCGLQEPIVGRAMQVLRGIFAQEGSANTSGFQTQSDRKKAIPNVSNEANICPNIR